MRPGATKQAVPDKHKQLAGKIENVEPVLQAVSGKQFFNTSPLTFTNLLDDPNTIADSLQLYIASKCALLHNRRLIHNGCEEGTNCEELLSAHWFGPASSRRAV